MPSLLESIFGGEKARKEWESQIGQGERYVQTPSLIETFTDEEKRKKWTSEYEAEKQRRANELPASVRETIAGYANEPTTTEQRDFSRRAAGMNLAETVDTIVGEYTPRIRVNNEGNGLVLSGTKTALGSDLAKELRQYLTDALQYQDLQSENTAKIIEELNADLASQIRQSVVENGIGANYEDYKNYAHALEIMKSTNPMNKTGDKNKIVWNGEAKTPQEWVNYFRDNYNAQERAKLFIDSANALADNINLNDYIPYLIMSGGEGGSRPLYGFDAGEKFEAFAAKLLNEGPAKFLEGIAQADQNIARYIANAPGYDRVRNVNTIMHDLGGDDISSSSLKWMPEDEFNNKIRGLIGKKLDELSVEDRSLLAAAISEKYLAAESPIYSFAHNPNWVKTFVANEDGIIDDNFLQAVNYDDYIRAYDNISTTDKYEKEMDKVAEQTSAPRKWLEDKLDAAAIYAPVSVGAGHLAGTMLRFILESKLVGAVTGVDLMNIGDSIFNWGASEILEGAGKSASLATLNSAINTPLGRFIGLVITEIPEDIVQTAVDNVWTGHGEENEDLFTFGNIANNTMQNLIMRGVFSLGANAVKTSSWYNKLKQSVKNFEDGKRVYIDWLTDDYATLKAANDSGRVTGVTPDGKFKVMNDDGVEQVLDNTYVLAFRNMDEYPVLQELARKFEPADAEITYSAIDDARKAVENGDYDDISTGVIRKGVTYNEDGELVDFAGRKVALENSDSETVIYRGQPIGEDGGFRYNYPDAVIKGADDAFSFMGKPEYAAAFGDELVYFKVNNDKILSLEDVKKIQGEAENLFANISQGNNIAEKYTKEQAELLSRIYSGDTRAIAEYAQKPIIVIADRGDSGLEYRYFSGVDENFDEGARTNLLASATAGTPGVNAANISMANSLQTAIDTQPYNKTPAEIIADKYTNSGSIADAPNSASVKWETPGVDGAYQDIRHAMADQPTNLNMPEVREWSQKALNTARKHYTDNIAPAFNERYPTPTDQRTFVRNMHYLFDLQKMDKLTLDQAVGKTFVDIDGVELKVSQSDVDFYNEVLAPYMKELRDYSMAGLKLDSDALESKMTVGYLPHTSYDPMDMTSEEALQQGNLYRTYSGASASTEDGNFTTTTLGDDLAEEFDIFAKNMIWDSLGDKAIVAKIMSELHADGVEATAESVQDVISSQRKIADATSKSSSAKKVSKHLKSDKSDFDWKAFSDEVAENAKKVGATKAINASYSKVYGSARAGAYTQPKIISVQQTSDIMRKISTPDGDMYHNGGRMVVAGAADAGYMVKRIFDQADEGHINAAEVKQMFVDYLAQDGKRTAKGAEYIADQWMRKISQDVNNTDGISRVALTARLNSLVYFEGSSRLKRWIGRADLSNFNDKTIGWMDEFFFRQGLLGRQLGDADLMGRINSAINGLISARMKSLFWLNFKNGVLQSSECVRLFTEFGMGDALKTIQRLSSDGDFRANVREWVDLIVPEGDFSKSAEAIDILADIAKKSEIVDGDISVGKLSKLEEDSLFKKIDEAAMTPVNMGENAKNFVLMAGILQEAERKGLEGDALFNFVNKKFERIGLANNAMGRLAGADNPAFRLATNLKSFSIRQFNMYINNISDMNGGEAVGYIIKNLGWKLGVAVILAKLGYSVPQSLGLDPFDILSDDYTGVDEEDYNELDKVIAGPAGRALLSGGFTSYLADLYWASRQAYEQKISTPVDEVDRKFQERGIFELAQPEISFDNILNIGAGFIPGYTQGKRVIDMAELQASGWAVSATGNKMYAAPDNAFDTATGYIFGRSNTPNARTYYQTADPLQGLIEGGVPGFNQQFFGRGFNLGGGYRNFDPVDSQNYSDWFYGDSRDDQQWNAGYYFFRQRAQQLQNEYQQALQNSYDEDSRNAVYESYNAHLRELDDSIARFVKAYQDKNGGKFDANKMDNVLTVMRTYQPNLSADELERTQQFFDADNAALQRYVAAGLPRVVSYEYNVNKEKPEESKTVVKYSPQVRAAMEGRYGLPKEASRLIKQVYNDKWKELNKEYREKYYNTKNSKEKKAIQADFFNLVRKDLDPIVAMYGAEIFSNDDVDDVMEDVFNSMTPYGTSVKKYLQGKYENYMAGTIQYSQPGNETITEIKGLLDQGKTARGKALARTLLQRVQENRQALTRDELEWLQGVLND